MTVVQPRRDACIVIVDPITDATDIMGIHT